MLESSYVASWNILMKFYSIVFMLFFLMACGAKPPPSPSTEQVLAAEIPLGEEYKSHSRYRSSGKVNRTNNSSTARAVALYLPNRVMDFLDIFRFDVGIGASTGAAVRVTKWGQCAWRTFWPGSLRLGLRGRKLPIFIEDTREFGVGSNVSRSKERTVTPLEVGAGVDLFLLGGYAGISIDSIADFLLGIFGIDISDDDYT